MPAENRLGVECSLVWGKGGLPLYHPSILPALILFIVSLISVGLALGLRLWPLLALFVFFPVSTIYCKCVQRNRHDRCSWATKLNWCCIKDNSVGSESQQSETRRPRRFDPTPATVREALRAGERNPARKPEALPAGYIPTRRVSDSSGDSYQVTVSRVPEPKLPAITPYPENASRSRAVSFAPLPHGASGNDGTLEDGNHGNPSNPGNLGYSGDGPNDAELGVENEAFSDSEVSSEGRREETPTIFDQPPIQDDSPPPLPPPAYTEVISEGDAKYPKVTRVTPRPKSSNYNFRTTNPDLC